MGDVRVFLLDDHEIVRRGIAEVIGLQSDITVVGEAGTAAEAITRIRASQPDVAIFDVRLADGDGIEVCREIRSLFPHIQVLMLTSYSDDEALLNAFMAGASGYILKEIRGSDLISTIRQVAAGHSLLDPSVAKQVLERLRIGNKEKDELSGLTEQEKAILNLIGEGMTNRQIGERMHLAEKTIKNYVTGLLAKLGMQRRTQAAAYVARLESNSENQNMSQ
jgi:two-component system response regulator DevR